MNLYPLSDFQILLSFQKQLKQHKEGTERTYRQFPSESNFIMRDNTEKSYIAMHVYTLYAIAHVHDIFLRIYNYSTITAKFIFTTRRLD